MTPTPAPEGACPICAGMLWVCEDDSSRPWDPSDDDCGAGMPCECNRGDKEHPPKPTPGSVLMFSVDECPGPHGVH